MPTGEIPLAGHPTVATVTAMVGAGMVDLSSDPGGLANLMESSSRDAAADSKAAIDALVDWLNTARS